MDLKEYISSGILEAYLMGELPTEEAAQVAAMADQHEAIRNELNRIEIALEQYAVLHGTTPPAGTLTNIQTKITNQGHPSGNSGIGKGLFYTTLLVSILAGALSVWYAVNYRQVDQLLTESEQELANLVLDCELQGERLERQNALLELLLNPNTQRVKMQGTDLAPQAVAQVFINPNDQQVYLDTGTLPEAAPDKSYQLWALVDGQPIDMGIFETKQNEEDIITVPFIEGAQTYAVTLEEQGGRPQPNLDQLYVIGNVG